MGHRKGHSGRILKIGLTLMFKESEISKLQLKCRVKLRTSNYNIHHFSNVVDFSSEEFSGSTGQVVLLDTGTPDTSREIYSEDADDGTRTESHHFQNNLLQNLQRDFTLKKIATATTVDALPILKFFRFSFFFFLTCSEECFKRVQSASQNCLSTRGSALLSIIKAVFGILRR